MTFSPALYFPDFPADPAIAAALGRFFSSLAYYHGPAVEPLPEPWRALAAEGLLQGREPVDLGGEGVRFRQLLTELAVNPAAFQPGLLTGAEAGRPEAGWDLVGSLRGSKAAIDRETTLLWRALLLVELAARRQRQEVEMAAGLQAVAARQAALLRELRGDEEEFEPEDEGAEELAATLAAMAPERPAALGDSRLLLAWGQLFLRDRQEAPLLVTADEDAFALLAETSESLSGRPPQPLGETILATAAGPAVLQFFVLPALSLSALFRHLCGRTPAPEEQQKSRGEAPRGLLALVRQVKV